jgi:hypothetical protein
MIPVAKIVAAPGRGALAAGDGRYRRQVAGAPVTRGAVTPRAWRSLPGPVPSDGTVAYDAAPGIVNLPAT